MLFFLPRFTIMGKRFMKDSFGAETLAAFLCSEGYRTPAAGEFRRFLRFHNEIFPDPARPSGGIHSFG